MPPLQQHIEDSLEKFDNQFRNISGQEFGNKWMYREDLSYSIKTFIKQSLLEQVDILRREVENLHSFETEDFIFPPAVNRQDVLDLLKTNKE